jgi:hypothetical protein
MSRGLVLTNIVAADSPLSALSTYDLDNIEPFTIILFSQGTFTEFRWDGASKHFKDLDISIPHIYSSATLYEPRIIAERSTGLMSFYTDHTEKTPESVRTFHSSAGRGDAQNGLIINRGGVLRTQCITQAVWQCR